MNKRFTSLALVFVMVLSMLATAAPAFAAPSASSCTFTVEADKTSASPDETINFTVYMQQAETMTCFGGVFDIPAGLTFVDNSGVLEDGLSETLNWTGAGEGATWSQLTMYLYGFGAEDFTGTEKIPLMKFQCTVNSDAAEQDYVVNLIELEAMGGSTEGYADKTTVSCVPVTITVTGAPSHTHSVTKVNQVDADCTTDGMKEHYKCSCGKRFEDAAASTETTEAALKIPALGHDYATTWSSDAANHWHECTRCGDKKDTAAHTPGAPATETTPQTCTVCGYVIAPATGHTHSVTKVNKVDADCTTDGMKEHYKCSCGKLFEDAAASTETTEAALKIPALGHDYAATWSSDAANHWHACSRCGDKKDTAAHTPGAPATETTPQTCTVCGYVIAPATGHTHSVTKVNKVDADCTTDGVKEHYKCFCGKLFEDAAASVETTKAALKIPALGHSYATTWSSDAANHWHECSRCGDKKDTAAHTPGAPATETTPQTCTVCGYVIAPATGSGSGGGSSSVTTYAITVKDAENGDVTASHKNAARGATVTLTVVPDKGYVLDTLQVLNSKNQKIKLTEKNGKYTFSMPAGKVTVEASFKVEAPLNPFTDVPEDSW